MLGSLKRIARLSARKRVQHPRVEWLESRKLLTQFTVTNTMDSGQGSLRQAITLANADNTIGADTISFKIGTGGTQTIALQSPLPAITRSVAIDGTTQPGSAAGTGAPTIVIDGANAGVGADGLMLTGATGGSAVRGLAIVNFKAATDGTGGRAIFVNDGGGDSFLGNYLGVDPDGSTARSNAVGIEIQSANNIVGSTTATSATTPGANLISGNTSDGVLITGAKATANQVVGNRIGTDITGTRAVGNLHGVTIASASNNTIGGATANARNLISGNAGPDQVTGVGVYINGISTNNVITGNEIGTNQAGTGVLYNTYGIYLGTVGVSGRDTISKTTIGGTTAGSGNLISGNGIGIAGNVQSSLIAGNLIGTDATGQVGVGNGYGIYLGASGTQVGGTTAATRNVIAASGLISSGGIGMFLTGDSNTVAGNYIGTNADGTRALPNQVGLQLLETNSTIGGTAAGAGNVIAGNSGDGMTLDNYGSNRVLGNRIGTSANGAALGNGGDGIDIILTTPTGAAAGLPVALNDTIGGITAGAANVIANNVGAGVAVTANGVAYTGLAIRGNSISSNGDLGISLGTSPDVPTPSTLALTSTTSTATGSTVQGVLGGLPGQTYQVDVFSNTAADPTGYGEGQTYLGTASVVIGGGGLATFSQTFATPIAAGSVVTATATNITGTSVPGTTTEFSAAYPNTLDLANLGITQTVTPGTVTNGGIVTFTATITNTGSTTAQDVVYTDALPLSLVNATITTSAGTSTRTAGNVALVQLGDLAAGASVTVTIAGNASANGVVHHHGGGDRVHARVRLRRQPGEPDLHRGDDRRPVGRPGGHHHPVDHDAGRRIELHLHGDRHQRRGERRHQRRSQRLPPGERHPRERHPEPGGRNRPGEPGGGQPRHDRRRGLGHPHAHRPTNRRRVDRRRRQRGGQSARPGRDQQLGLVHADRRVGHRDRDRDRDRHRHPPAVAEPGDAERGRQRRPDPGLHPDGPERRHRRRDRGDPGRHAPEQRPLRLGHAQSGEPGHLRQQRRHQQPRHDRRRGHGHSNPGGRPHLVRHRPGQLRGGGRHGGQPDRARLLDGAAQRPERPGGRLGRRVAVERPAHRHLQLADHGRIGDQPGQLSAI